jgi:hypothetical protein
MFVIKLPSTLNLSFYITLVLLLCLPILTYLSYVNGYGFQDTIDYTCIDFGPSGVRALPLGVAAERSVHY